MELQDVKKKKQGMLTITLQKIDKKFPTYELKVDVMSGEIALELENSGKTSYFLVLKMGETHIKTKNSESGSKEPNWAQTFAMKSVEESSLVVELWSEDAKNTAYLGVVTIKLTDSINKKNAYDLVGSEQKKIGHVLLRIYEEGKAEEPRTEEIVVNDKNIIPVRMLKMYILEALMKQDSKSKNAYIKV